MKPAAFDYYAPASVDDALARLSELGDEGKVLAGGQSLVPMMNMRLATPGGLVDIGGIDELNSIEVDADTVTVGANVTAEQLRTHTAAIEACPLLRQGLDHVSHRVIRNRGTVVGSLVHADPAGEMPGVFALLDAEIEIRHRDHTRTVTGSELFLGALEADVGEGELATKARFPVTPERTGSAFHELSRRHGDYALAGVAALVAVDADATLATARLAVIGVADRPVVLDLTEPLQQRRPDDLEAAVKLVREHLDPVSDIHGSADYRRHLAGVLAVRALTEAAGNARSRERSVT